MSPSRIDVRITTLSPFPLLHTPYSTLTGDWSCLPRWHAPKEKCTRLCWRGRSERCALASGHAHTAPSILNLEDVGCSDYRRKGRGFPQTSTSAGTCFLRSPADMASSGQAVCEPRPGVPDWARWFATRGFCNHHRAMPYLGYTAQPGPYSTPERSQGEWHGALVCRCRTSVGPGSPPLRAR